MDELIELHEKPVLDDLCLIAGWRQWADAGSVSSELPLYLAQKTEARKIGEIRSDRFYLFQLPGAQALFRPEIKLEEGYRAELRAHRNEIFYADTDAKFLIFVGDEPHLNVERYADAFFNLANMLRVRRIAALGGVYSAVPFEKERQVTCTYSLKKMKEELAQYAVNFSNYEGGVSIGSYLADRAEKLGIEYFGFYAIVPMYDLSQLSPLLRELMLEHDYKAWHDVMRRLNYMFRLGFDLSELERQSDDLIHSIQIKIDDLEKAMPQVGIRQHLAKLGETFTEPSFTPLDDVWEKGLGDLFKDL